MKMPSAENPSSAAQVFSKHYDLSLCRGSLIETISKTVSGSWVCLFYVIRGEIELDVQKSSHLVKPGDLFLFWREESCHVTRESSDFACYLIQFDREVLYSASQSFSTNQFLFAFTAAGLNGQRLFSREELTDTKLLSLLTELLEEYNSPGYCSEVSIQLLLSQISLWILRFWKTKNTDALLSQKNDLYVMNLLKRIFSYVDTEYSNKIKMEDVANLVNMSYYSFSKFFINHTGKTFPSYVNEVRLTKSKILLTTTGMSITDIAMEVGYTSTSRYIQHFKESNQMTPQQFRKEFRKGV